MRIEIKTDVIIIKHEAEGRSDCSGEYLPGVNDYHTFSVWHIQGDTPAREKFNWQTGGLVQTFEGDYTEARSECRSMLDAQYFHLPQIWIQKEDEIYVCE